MPLRLPPDGRFCWRKWTPRLRTYIRGEERLALVEDLALKKPHAELAEKYGKSVPAINQFSQRNAPEIATRRQVLLAQVDAEAAHLWISDKVTRRAWRQKMIEDMEVALADPDLDWRQRSRYNRDIAMLLHQGYADFGGLPNGVGCGFCGGFPHVPGLVGFGGIVFTGDGLRIDPPLGIPRMSCSSSSTAGSPLDFAQMLIRSFGEYRIRKGGRGAERLVILPASAAA